MFSINVKDFIELPDDKKASLESVKFVSDDNNFQWDEASIKSYGNALLQCGRIHHIDLYDNKLGLLEENLIQLLGKELSACKTLRHLGLGSNNLSALRVSHLIKQCTNLESLNLSANRINQWKEIDFLTFGEGLEQNKSLKILDLTNNNLYQLEHFLALSNALSQCGSLQCLNLQDNNLSKLRKKENGVRNFCMLLSNLNVQQLDLGYNELSELQDNSKNIEDVVEALSHSGSLRQLSLAGNALFNLALSNIEIFFEGMLSKCSKLFYLDVSHNGFGKNRDKFAKFCNVLSKCSKLQFIDLSFNSLNNPNSLKMLGKALLPHETIQRLELRNNDLGYLDEESFKEVITQLSKCVNLEYLGLKNNMLCQYSREGFDRNGKTTFESIFKGFKDAEFGNLRYLDLRENMLDRLDTRDFQEFHEIFYKLEDLTIIDEKLNKRLALLTTLSQLRASGDVEENAQNIEKEILQKSPPSLLYQAAQYILRKGIPISERFCNTFHDDLKRHDDLKKTFWLQGNMKK